VKCVYQNIHSATCAYGITNSILSLSLSVLHEECNFVSITFVLQSVQCIVSGLRKMLGFVRVYAERMLFPAATTQQKKLKITHSSYNHNSSQ